jgi:hypothetical protein
MATLNLADGESFVKGRSGAKARELLELAGERGGEVRTASHGYIVPSDILPEGYEGAVTNADLPAVTTEPGTPTEAEHTYNVGGAREAEVGTPLPKSAKLAERGAVIPVTAPVGAEGEQGAPAQETAEEPAGEFDPSKATVDEVEEYLAGADDAERARVIAAEEEGKKRKGVLDLAATTEEGAK